MTWMKRVLLVALAVAVIGIAAFALMAAKDQSYVPSAPYSPQGEPNRDVAVVYYSRSGHSEAVAREIARTFNAPIARIRSDLVRRTAAPDRAHDPLATSQAPQTFARRDLSRAPAADPS